MIDFEIQKQTNKTHPYPPIRLIPVVLKLKDTYNIWQNYLSQFPKANRFTIGSKIDILFLEAIEYSFSASYAHNTEKQIFLNRSISKVDLIKLLLQLSWEIKALDNKKYIHLSLQFSEIGKMLGGWKKQLLNKTSETNPGRNIESSAPRGNGSSNSTRCPTN
jgi:hypothetical protein